MPQGLEVSNFRFSYERIPESFNDFGVSVDHSNRRTCALFIPLFLMILIVNYRVCKFSISILVIEKILIVQGFPCGGFLCFRLIDDCWVVLNLLIWGGLIDPRASVWVIRALSDQ